MEKNIVDGRIWGLQPKYDSGRMIHIYEAIKDKEVKSIIDIACGYGIVADGLRWAMPEAEIEQFDLFENQEWAHLDIKPYVMDVVDFVKTDKKYDVVLFLNSFRNWQYQAEFKEWLKGHAKYFISSEIGEEVEIIGEDGSGHKLELWKL